MREIQTELKNSNYTNGFIKNIKTWQNVVFFKTAHLLNNDSELDIMLDLRGLIAGSFNDAQIFQIYRSIRSFKPLVPLKRDYITPFTEYMKKWFGKKLPSNALGARYDNKDIILYFIPFVIFIEALKDLQEYKNRLSKILGITFVSE